MKKTMISLRIVLYMLSCTTIFFISLPLNFPSFLGIGEVRILVVAFTSKLLEELLVYMVEQQNKQHTCEKRRM